MPMNLPCIREKDKAIRVGRRRKRSLPALLALLALPAPQNCDMLVSHRNIPFQFVIEDCDLLDRVQSL
jgi:hypothetical protein